MSSKIFQPFPNTPGGHSRDRFSRSFSSCCCFYPFYPPSFLPWISLQAFLCRKEESEDRLFSEVSSRCLRFPPFFRARSRTALNLAFLFEVVDDPFSFSLLSRLPFRKPRLRCRESHKAPKGFLLLSLDSGLYIRTTPPSAMNLVDFV